MHGREPSNINLVIIFFFFVPLKFAGFHNQFLILTLVARRATTFLKATAGEAASCEAHHRLFLNKG